MSLFKKLALVGAFSAVMFLGLAVGSVSADDDHDHHHHFNETECFNEATGTIDLSKCPMILTSNGWFVYPNQYSGFHQPFIFYNPNFFYNPYAFHGHHNPYQYNFGYPLYNHYPW